MAGEPYGMGVPPDFWNTFDQQQQPQAQGNPQADLMQIAAANFQQQQQAEEERRRQEELIRAQAAAREQDKQNYIKVSAAKAYNTQDALTAQQKAAEAFDKINPPIPVATGVAPPPIDANQTFMNAQKTAQQLRDQQLQNTMQPGTVLNPQNVLPPNITAMQRRTQKLTPEQVNQNLMADNFVPTQVNGKTVWTNSPPMAKGNPSVEKMVGDVGFGAPASNNSSNILQPQQPGQLSQQDYLAGKRIIPADKTAGANKVAASEEIKKASNDLIFNLMSNPDSAPDAARQFALKYGGTEPLMKAINALPASQGENDPFGPAVAKLRQAIEGVKGQGPVPSPEFGKAQKAGQVAIQQLNQGKKKEEIIAQMKAAKVPDDVIKRVATFLEHFSV